jgi:hypothetical protein
MVRLKPTSLPISSQHLRETDESSKGVSLRQDLLEGVSLRQDSSKGDSCQMQRASARPSIRIGNKHTCIKIMTFLKDAKPRSE